MNFRVEYFRPKDLSESLSDALHFGGNFAAVFTLTITHFTLIGYDLHYVNTVSFLRNETKIQLSEQ